jgi:hypothetical protein
MVLQRGSSAVVFGGANATVPSDTVTVSISPPLTASASGDNGPWTAVAQADGSWSIKLPQFVASSDPLTMSVASSQTAAKMTLSNVLRGDVILWYM